MKASSLFLAMGMLVACACPLAARATRLCAEKLADDLLSAILARDEKSLKEIANNPAVFDDLAVDYLLGNASARFHGRSDLKPAHAVLEGKQVLKKVTIAELQDGSKVLEVIYLPTDTTADFGTLATMAKANGAVPFRNYVMCSIVIRDNSVFMPHACYAETDALD